MGEILERLITIPRTVHMLLVLFFACRESVAPGPYVGRAMVKRGYIGTQCLKIGILCHFRYPKVSETSAWGWLVWCRTWRKSVSCRSVVGSCERYPSVFQMALFQQWDPILHFSSLRLSSYHVTLPWILLTMWLLGCVSRALKRKAGG